MNRIVVSDPLRDALDGVALPVELIDDTGRRLGHFVPAARDAGANDECPYAPEALAQMRAETGGRPLTEIWESLEGP